MIQQSAATEGEGGRERERERERSLQPAAKKTIHYEKEELIWPPTARVPTIRIEDYEGQVLSCLKTASFHMHKV